MSILADGTITSYGGYTFPGGTSTRISISPVYDGAERTVIYVACTLRVTWRVISANPSAHEAAMLSIERALTHAGGNLVYQSHGVGPVASSINLKDVKWGPKPGRLEKIPLGPIGAELSWSVEVHYPMCASARGARFPMAYNYNVDYTIDGVTGYTTRRISGYLEMPLARVGNSRQLAYTADEFWESIIPDEIPGFDRPVKSRTISDDKRTLRFNFVDEEQKGPKPKDIPQAEGSFSIQSNQISQTLWYARLSATYTLSKYTPRQAAIDAFATLLNAKIQSVPRKNGISSALITSFSADEGLYSQADRVSFNATFRFTSSLLECIKDCGMFEPIPGSDNWFAWRGSPNNQAAMSPRGSAGLRLSPKDDAIVDLCGGVPSGPTSGTVIGGRSVPQKGIATLTKISPETSWLEYQADIQVREEASVAVLKSIPPKELGNTTIKGGAGNPLTPSPGQLRDSGGKPPPFPFYEAPKKDAEPLDEIQTRAASTYYLNFSGVALRAGFAIPQPSVKFLDGLDGKLIKSGFMAGQVAEYSAPVYRAVWEFEWQLTGDPAGKVVIKQPENPAFERKV
jgi:hypothetical protein